VKLSTRQRFLYLDLARRAHARVFDPDDPTAPTLDDWRRAESRFACGKSWSDGLTNDDLTRCLQNFTAWLARQERASADELDAAVARNAPRKLASAIEDYCRTLGRGYVLGIIRQQFPGKFFFEQLDQREKTLLLTTCARAASRKEKSATTEPVNL